jgi:hypothetical protein
MHMNVDRVGLTLTDQNFQTTVLARIIHKIAVSLCKPLF